MYQEVNGIWMEVVDLKVMPELPVTGYTVHEQTERAKYSHIVKTAAFGEQFARWGFQVGVFADWLPESGLVARALTAAIEAGLITEPGKYGIEIIGGRNYNVYTL